MVNGLDRLIKGLDAVGSRRNFKVRIGDSGRDEFGTISGSINKLIAIAGSVIEDQEALSTTDGLTGVVNRRGFDQKLAACTTVTRAHALRRMKSRSRPTAYLVTRGGSVDSHRSIVASSPHVAPGCPEDRGFPHIIPRLCGVRTVSTHD